MLYPVKYYSSAYAVYFRARALSDDSYCLSTGKCILVRYCSSLKVLLISIR